MYNLLPISRFSKTLTCKIVCIASLSCLSFSSWAFTFNDVVTQAEKLSKKAYVQPSKNIPSELSSLQFADYQKIYFKHDKAYWSDRKSRFKLEFYHEGMYFDVPVKINEIVNNQVNEIKFSPDYFDLSPINLDKLDTKKLGFAGFKVHYPINNPAKTDDEIFTALGGSYFRAVGKNQHYGLSARGLAIDTGEMSGEEFPRFKEYWIERPEPNQKHLVIYALLDSKSVTGAYKITLIPSVDTTITVEAKVFFRDSVKKLGVAPLTSMFLFGPNQPSPLLNYRPAMHDSNGLSIQAKNEWIWRPLNNPKRLSFSSYSLESPKAFGLIQRDKGFDDYQDLDDHYELRPSVWVEILNDWHKGRVELVEIPTADETNDNIVTYWVPEKQYKAGDVLDVKYRLHYSLNEQQRYPKNEARAESTRLSLGDIKQANLIRKLDGSNAYVVDFVGPNLSEQDPVDVISSINNGSIVSCDTQYNSVTKGWRVLVRFNVEDNKKPTDIRLQLSSKKSHTIVSETWSGQFPAQ
ncbi:MULTISPECIES: glucan biosynthesis protein G [unclassified Gilliamella]|uniref:glucan biosynthesis protein G n=1 Tax=unclassified Gilliamella TaxID=2685620 RepID=UPI00080DF5AD|nr:MULTISPECIES: glucan biosynthesis protein G [Gilliamella]MCX8580927.1 glucan biosynthesis protein G [Gilliamella sp. B3482]MCX8583617.1 glucan biosynthesis protein G [Gilliamella sp. B3372]MCX8586680.1 glucan biosynthesis protein G [Gilliamella sp. B3562]MCX8594749.1 glucan biosynthesis protein G [Gilliamella sp. B3367]MCX8597126.1 glucan biosynthesis protein G [Gilliamella sp. B3493]